MHVAVGVMSFNDGQYCKIDTPPAGLRFMLNDIIK